MLQHHQPPPLLFSITASLFSFFLQTSRLLSETVSGNTGLIQHEPYMPHFRNSKTDLLSLVPVLKAFPGKASCCPSPGQLWEVQVDEQGKLPAQWGCGHSWACWAIFQKAFYMKRRWHEGTKTVFPRIRACLLLCRVPSIGFSQKLSKTPGAKGNHWTSWNFPTLGTESCLYDVHFWMGLACYILFVWSKFQV